MTYGLTDSGSLVLICDSIRLAHALPLEGAPASVSACICICMHMRVHTHTHVCKAMFIRRPPHRRHVHIHAQTHTVSLLTFANFCQRKVPLAPPRPLAGLQVRVRVRVQTSGCHLSSVPAREHLLPLAATRKTVKCVLRVCVCARLQSCV